MINNIVANVYVLNLEEDTFKYNILKRKLDKLNIKHQRFEAINGVKQDDKYNYYKIKGMKI